MAGLTDREVTAYTAGLWRNRPVPAGEPEPAPEYVYSTVALPGGRVTAARVRGKRHRHDGTNCDDWYEAAGFEKITCVAVSDGAGSKKLSRIGARVSCRRAADAMTRLLEEAFSARAELWEYVELPLSDGRCMEACGVLAEIVQRAVGEAGGAVQAAFEARRERPEYAALLGREPQLADFSGTLLAAVLLPVGGGMCLAAACQVGDGEIALLDTAAGPSVKLLGAAQRGRFAGETEFLTTPGVLLPEALQRRTRVARCAADLALVMTDGVADDYFPAEAELPRLYRDLAAAGVFEEAGEASPGLRLKGWLEGYTRRGSFDDRTLVAVQL